MEQSQCSALGIRSSKVWKRPFGKTSCNHTGREGGIGAMGQNIARCGFVKPKQVARIVPCLFLQVGFCLFPQFGGVHRLFSPFFETKEKREH